MSRYTDACGDTYKKKTYGGYKKPEDKSKTTTDDKSKTTTTTTQTQCSPGYTWNPQYNCCVDPRTGMCIPSSTGPASQAGCLPPFTWNPYLGCVDQFGNPAPSGYGATPYGGQIPYGSSPYGGYGGGPSYGAPPYGGSYYAAPEGTADYGNANVTWSDKYGCYVDQFDQCVDGGGAGYVSGWRRGPWLESPPPSTVLNPFPPQSPTPLGPMLGWWTGPRRGDSGPIIITPLPGGGIITTDPSNPIIPGPPKRTHSMLGRLGPFHHYDVCNPYTPAGQPGSCYPPPPPPPPPGGYHRWGRGPLMEEVCNPYIPPGQPGSCYPTPPTK